MESQNERFDKECKYVKKWVPELKNVPAKDIITWETSHKKHKVYVKPILDLT